jgi:hypothetical protein
MPKQQDALDNTGGNNASSQTTDGGTRGAWSRNTTQAEHNKPSSRGSTQRNEPRRTPLSRNDREGQVGSSNQHSTRQGGGRQGAG